MQDTDKLRQLAKRMRALSSPRFKRALARNLAEEGVRLAGESFRTSTDPYGKPWKPAWRGGQTLRDTGRLQRSISYSDITPEGFKLGSNVRYARIHNLGGDIRAKTAKGLRFWLNDGYDIATAKTSLKTRKTNYRRTKPKARKRMVIVQKVTMPRRTFVPVQQTGGLGKWSDSFERVTRDLIKQALETP